MRFVRSRSASATPVRVTNDPNALAVRLTDDQIRERYPWDYRELTKECRKRYRDFKVDDTYHQLRKSLAGNQRFAYVRLLDPQQPKFPTKTFYSQMILNELDKHYKKLHSLKPRGGD